jgi:hypothetical protein
MLITVNTKGEL